MLHIISDVIFRANLPITFESNINFLAGTQFSVRHFPSNELQRENGTKRRYFLFIIYGFKSSRGSSPYPRCTDTVFESSFSE